MMLKKLMLGSLLLTLSVTPYAKANESGNQTGRSLAPVSNCYTDDQLKSLAAFKLDCDVTKRNLADTKLALKVCTDNTCVVDFWQTPSFVIGGITVGVSVGLVAGYFLFHK